MTRPLNDQELAQVRAMLEQPVDATYDKNVQLLLGTARALLATLDARLALNPDLPASEHLPGVGHISPLMRKIIKKGES